MERVPGRTSGLFAALLDGTIGMRWALVACAVGYALVAGLQFARQWRGEASNDATEERSPL